MASVSQAGFVDKIFSYLKSFSLDVAVFSPSCCSGEIDLAFSSNYSTDRLGFSLCEDHVYKSDIFIIAGPLNKKYVTLIQNALEQSSSPKYIIALGSCAIDGNIFSHTDFSGGVDKVIPVDVYVPGCPPSPESIIYALHKLQHKIRKGYLKKQQPILSTKDDLTPESVDKINKFGFNFKIHVKANRVERLETQSGYSFRALEEELQGRNILDALPYLSKIDYKNSLAGEILLVRYLEEHSSIKPLDKTKFLQVLLLELLRISSHLNNIGKLAKLFNRNYIFSSIKHHEEMLREIFEILCGRRYPCSIFLPGGLLVDLNEGFFNGVRQVALSLKGLLRNIDKTIFSNLMVKKQLRNLAPVSKKQAIEFSLSGPNLRATGLNIDCRLKSDFYSKVGFRAVLGRYGDTWDRFYCRYKEIGQSLTIVQDLVRNFPKEEARVVLQEHQEIFHVSAPAEYIAVESSRGELGLYIDLKSGTISQLGIREPSSFVINMLNQIPIDLDIDHMNLFLTSFDIDTTEVDK